MQVTQEHVNYQNPFLRLKIWQIDNPFVSRDAAREPTPASPRWHYHKEIEFLLILRGRMQVFLPEESHVIGPGDVLLIGSSQLHRTVRAGTDDVSYLVFQLDLDKYLDPGTAVYAKYFTEVIQPLNRLNYIFAERPDVREETARLIRDIYREIGERDRGFEMAVSIRVREIFLLLLRSDRRQLIPALEDPALERVQPALQYIEERLADKLSIEEVCKRVNLSYYYFVKTFKKAVGLSFTDYVNRKRIQKAELLLLTGQDSVQAIAEAVGIPNMAHFYELFRRRNGCSPREYKSRMNGEKSESQTVPT